MTSDVVDQTKGKGEEKNPAVEGQGMGGAEAEVVAAIEEASAAVDAGEAPDEETIDVETVTDVDLHAEIESLLEITKHKIHRDNMTPCAACTILISVTLNTCPHCESFVAPNNALLRESLRRLDEIRAGIDGDHTSHSQARANDNQNLSFGERFKRFFTGEQKQEIVIKPMPDPTARRILRNTVEGDPLKVLETDGPWFKVKTRDGQTGWVYSTIMDDH